VLDDPDGNQLFFNYPSENASDNVIEMQRNRAAQSDSALTFSVCLVAFEQRKPTGADFWNAGITSRLPSLTKGEITVEARRSKEAWIRAFFLIAASGSDPARSTASWTCDTAR